MEKNIRIAEATNIICKQIDDEIMKRKIIIMLAGIATLTIYFIKKGELIDKQ